MLDILKEYQKKCHLRNKSNDEETSKKLREGSLDNSSACSDVSVNNDAFTEGLKSPECVISWYRVLILFREELNEDVLLVDLDRTHRIVKKETQTANHGQLLSNLLGIIFEKVFKSKKKKRNWRKILLGTEWVFQI